MNLTILPDVALEEIALSGDRGLRLNELFEALAKSRHYDTVLTDTKLQEYLWRRICERKSLLKAVSCKRIVSPRPVFEQLTWNVEKSVIYANDSKKVDGDDSTGKPCKGNCCTDVTDQCLSLTFAEASEQYGTNLRLIRHHSIIVQLGGRWDPSVSLPAFCAPVIEHLCCQRETGSYYSGTKSPLAVGTGLTPTNAGYFRNLTQLYGLAQWRKVDVSRPRIKSEPGSNNSELLSSTKQSGWAVVLNQFDTSAEFQALAADMNIILKHAKHLADLIVHLSKSITAEDETASASASTVKLPIRAPLRRCLESSQSRSRLYKIVAQFPDYFEIRKGENGATRKEISCIFLKKFFVDEKEKTDENSDDDGDDDSNATGAKNNDPAAVCLTRPQLRQVADVLRDHAPAGLTMRQICDLTHLPHYVIRRHLSVLVSTGFVVTKMDQSGRVRMRLHFATEKLCEGYKKHQAAPATVGDRRTLSVLAFLHEKQASTVSELVQHLRKLDVESTENAAQGIIDRKSLIRILNRLVCEEGSSIRALTMPNSIVVYALEAVAQQDSAAVIAALARRAATSGQPQLVKVEPEQDAVTFFLQSMTKIREVKQGVNVVLLYRLPVRLQALHKYLCHLAVSKQTSRDGTTGWIRLLNVFDEMPISVLAKVEPQAVARAFYKWTLPDGFQLTEDLTVSQLPTRFRERLLHIQHEKPSYSLTLSLYDKMRCLSSMGMVTFFEPTMASTNGQSRRRRHHTVLNNSIYVTPRLPYFSPLLIGNSDADLDQLIFQLWTCIQDAAKSPTIVKNEPRADSTICKTDLQDKKSSMQNRLADLVLCADSESTPPVWDGHQIGNGLGPFGMLDLSVSTWFHKKSAWQTFLVVPPEYPVVKSGAKLAVSGIKRRIHQKRRFAKLVASAPRRKSRKRSASGDGSDAEASSPQPKRMRDDDRAAKVRMTRKRRQAPRTLGNDAASKGRPAYFVSAKQIKVTSRLLTTDGANRSSCFIQNVDIKSLRGFLNAIDAFMDDIFGPAAEDLASNVTHITLIGIVVVHGFLVALGQRQVDPSDRWYSSEARRALVGPLITALPTLSTSHYSIAKAVDALISSYPSFNYTEKVCRLLASLMDCIMLGTAGHQPFPTEILQQLDKLGSLMKPETGSLIRILFDQVCSRLKDPSFLRSAAARDSASLNIPSVFVFPNAKILYRLQEFWGPVATAAVQAHSDAYSDLDNVGLATFLIASRLMPSNDAVNQAIYEQLASVKDSNLVELVMQRFIDYRVLTSHSSIVSSSVASQEMASADKTSVIGLTGQVRNQIIGNVAKTFMNNFETAGSELLSDGNIVLHRFRAGANVENFTTTEWLETTAGGLLAVSGLLGGSVSTKLVKPPEQDESRAVIDRLRLAVGRKRSQQSSVKWPLEVIVEAATVHVNHLKIALDGSIGPFPALSAEQSQLLKKIFELSQPSGGEYCRKSRLDFYPQLEADLEELCQRRLILRLLATKSMGEDRFIPIGSSTLNCPPMLPLPWGMPDGTVNWPAWKLLTTSLVLMIFETPPMTRDAVMTRFTRPALPTFAVDLLLNVLESEGIIESTLMPSGNGVVISLDNDDDYIPTTALHFWPICDGLLKLSRLFGSLG